LLYIIGADSKCNLCGGVAAVKKRLMAKQLRLKKALEGAGYPLFSYDRIIDAGCNRRRPDFVYDAGTHFVVVECDERQHTRGGYGCERRRMWEIAQALGLPVAFIRHNPDAYKTRSGKRGTAAAATREKTLLAWLQHLMGAGPPAHYLTALYLYYDGWSRGKPPALVEVAHPVLNETPHPEPEEAPPRLTDDEYDEVVGFA
jgi:hypothetical protein